VNTKRNEYNTEGAGFQGDARPAFLDPTQWREVRKGKWQHKTAGGVHFTLHRKGVKGSKNAEWTLDCQDPGESERRAYELGTYASLEELLRDEADTLVKRAGAGAATAAAAPLENGAEILDAMVAEIRKHIILEQHFAEAIALWIFHAHSIDAHRFSPRLHVLSPEWGCGKSTLLEVIEHLCGKGQRALLVSNLTAASLFRHITAFTENHGAAPIVLIDEIDSFLNSDRSDALNILKSGHKRASANVLRCNNAELNHAAGTFNAWAPLVLGGIGKLTDAAMASKTIAIPLKKKRKRERVEVFRDAAMARCALLARRAAQWAVQNDAKLREVDPEVTEILDNRIRDNWGPLVFVAEVVGGRWAEIAKSVALTIAGEIPEETTVGAMLLGDIRRVWPHTLDRLASSTLLEMLRRLPERPWGEKESFHEAALFDARKLSVELQPYGIMPKPLRFPGAGIARGYLRSQFEDAWSRYLDEESPQAEAEDEAAAGGVTAKLRHCYVKCYG
jgi:hypothetical protein